MLILDHIAIAATDLATGTDWVEQALGVTLLPGGKHAAYGTHNTLLGLGDIYLEVIALDPAVKRDRPAWFGLDHFDGPPRPANWICATDRLDISPNVTGPAQQLTRGALNWQITVPDDGHLPMGGAFPTLIKWGDDTVHPATALPDSGCRLHHWQVSHPEADTLRDRVQISDKRISFVTGPAGFRATIETPQGVRVLT